MSACCFFGHRKINMSDELKIQTHDAIKQIITNNCVDTFFFGSRSQFDALCYEIVSELKKEFAFLNRIYVRAEFPHISDDYEKYLLQYYEKTYFPARIEKAGKAIYIERNFEMIDNSSFCITYFDSVHNLKKSGTEIAYNYAVKKRKEIINLFNK